MIVDDDKDDKPVNECCQKWKQKLLKAENGRRMLREAIRLLEKGIEKAQAENDTLKKECEKERMRADTESKRIEEEKRLRVELEKAHDSLKVELASVLQRLSNYESQNKIQKDREEQMQAETESKRIEEEKRLRGELEKERNSLKAELASVLQRLNNYETQNKIQKDREERAETERRNSAQEKRLRELLKKEQLHADAERKKAEEAKKVADAEKRKAEEEKKRADVERKRADEERRFAEAERRNIEEERKRADSEMKKAEDEKRMREMLERKLQQLLLERKREKESNICQKAKENAHALCKNVEQDCEKRLKEKLKKERQQLKAERKRADEEKTQREALEEERLFLKEELALASGRLAFLEAQLKADAGGVERLRMEAGIVDDDAMHKVTVCRSKRSCKTTAAQPSRREKVLSCNQIQGNTVLNCSMPAKESFDPVASVSGGNFIEIIPGHGSMLEPSIGGSVERKVQSSASHSSITSFSDGKLVGSQGRDAVNVFNSSKVEKTKRKREKDILKRSLTTAKKICTEILALPEGLETLEDMTELNEQRSFVGKHGAMLNKLPENACASIPYEQTNGALKKSYGASKVRESESRSLVDSITQLFCTQKEAHLMIEEKLIALSETLRVEPNTSFDVLSPTVRNLREKNARLLGAERKVPSKRKRDTATKVQNKPNVKEDMGCKELERKECKARWSKKGYLSGNHVQIQVHDQGKEQTSVRDMCRLIGNGTLSNQVRETGDWGISNLIEVAATEQEDGICTKCMVDIDGKKMLELENECDEERYLQAKQSLLSPTLPEIPSPGSEGLGCDNSEPLDEEAPCKLIEPFTSAYSASILEMNGSLSNQDIDVKKIIEMENDPDDEAYLQAKQSLLSPTLPEIPFQVLEELEGNCFDPSFALFTSTDCGIGAAETNKTAPIPSLCDKQGNLEQNIQHESAGQDMGEHDAFPQSSPHGALDVENIGNCGGKISSDLSSENNSIFSDGTGLHVNEVAKSNIDQCKEFGMKSGHEGWGGLLEHMEGVTKKCEDESSQKTAGDDEKMGSYEESHNNCLSRNSLFSLGRVDCESIQLGFEKCTASETNVICRNCSRENSSLDEQRKGSNVEFEDRNQRGLSEGSFEQVKEISESCEGEVRRSFSGFVIISSYFGDENTLSSMFMNIEKYLGEDLDAAWKDFDLEKLVLTFASETKLLKEDIVCILISALMSSLASVEARNGASSSPDRSSFLCSKYLIPEINKVYSKHETKDTFLKVCAFDILLSLMTNFLMDGKVVVYKPFFNGDQYCSNLNGRLVKVENGQLLVFPRIATAAELRAGSNILGAFCLALGRVDCLYEVVYNLLRWCKKDSFWLLTVVHSFAFLCGKNFFQLNRNYLLGNTMHYIILVLEGHDKGVRPSWQNHKSFTSVQRQMFPRCICCPFAEDEFSRDAVISSLLGRLQQFHISGYLGEQMTATVLGCENSIFIVEAERKVESQNLSCSQNHLDMPAASLKNLEDDILNCGNQSSNPTVSADCHLSNLNDTVRALELFAQYLGWDWTYNELIPHLWKMAQPYAPEVFTAAIFMLLGNVGRFGVDYDGFEQRGVEELRCNFSMFLDLHCPMKGGQKFPFSSQLAVAQALFELVSVSMKTFVPNQTASVPGIVYEEMPTSKHLKILRKWYSELSAEQQSMAPEYLRTAILSLKN